MPTVVLGRPTGASPIASARHSSFPRALSPNEARWEPRTGSSRNCYSIGPSNGAGIREFMGLTRSS